MKISVMLADDHSVVREGLKALLEKEDDIQITAQAGSGREAITVCRDKKPEIILMDITMGDMNGIDATKQLKQEMPEVKVIALSMHSDVRFVSSMFEAGASGYLIKESPSSEVANAIRKVHGGEIYLCSDIQKHVVEDYARRMGEGVFEMESPLSSREREVLQLLAEGKNSKEIASELHLSVKTIETHRQHIADKLDIHNLADLTKYAIREGLTTAEE